MANESILKVENIKKAFGKRHVLKGVSLSICKGELKVLMGPSGAGKSTLLQCITFLVTPDEGEVWLEGGSGSFRLSSNSSGYGTAEGRI